MRYLRTVRYLFLLAALALNPGVMSAAGMAASSSSTCANPSYVVTDYSSLRTTAGQSGQTTEVTGTPVAGCFTYSTSDPNGLGDDGGIVIRSADGAYWVRQIAAVDASAAISASSPIELDWYELSNGEDITSLWNALASTYAPNFFIRVPSQPGTYDLGPFSTGTFDIDRLRIYESAASVTIRQRDAGETWIEIGTVVDLVLGTDVKKASRDDYNLTFQGSAHRSGYEYDAGSGNSMISLNPGYLDHCSCNWYLRANTKDSYAQGIKKAGVAYVDTIFVSGRHVNSSVEFSDFGKSFIANQVIAAENVYVSDPYGAGYGWKGASDGSTVSGTWSKNRGVRISGTSKVVGSVELQYGWTAFRSFFTDLWGDPGQPFTVTLKDQGFLGTESGYPGVKIKDSDPVLNNALKWDGQLDYDGYWVTSDPDDASHRRYFRVIEENQWGTNYDILSVFIESNLCDDNPNCTADSDLFMSYFDLTLTNLEGGMTGTAAGGVGSPYDRIHNWTIRGDGVNPASLPGSKPVRIAADHATFRDGQFHDVIYAKPSNLGDPGVTSTGNLGENLTITGSILIDDGVADVTLNSVTWSGSARQILTIPAGTSVQASNLSAPPGSTVGGSGTFNLNGQSTSLPYTFDGSEGDGSSGADTQAPTTPTGLSGTAASSSEIDLAWSASSDDVGVTGYRVFRNGTSVATTSATAYSDSGLSAGTAYSYAVSAMDAAGNTSPLSAEVSATTAGSGSSTSTLPAQSDWTDHGVVISPGTAGEWDHLIGGSFTPSTVVKKNGQLFLYYVGADGTRPDGGPANRTLGVATSSDGLTWTKYSGNPLISHQPDGGHGNVVEEGVFSAGAAVDGNGTVYMYYGGMETVSSTGVDSDGLLATSTDGLNFTVFGDVIDHNDSNVYRYGDEIFPVGARVDTDGTWSVYYIGKGSGGVWDLGLASGPSHDNLNTHVGVLDLSSEIKSGGDPIELPDGSIVVPVGVRYSDTAMIEMRTTTAGALHDLSTVTESYDFGDVKEFTIFLDADLGRWFMFFITEAEDGIHLRTAPLADTDSQVDSEAPSAPTSLSTTVVSSTQIDLSWAASADNVGVTGYRIFRDDILIATVAGTTYSDAALSAGTSYSYHVTAYDAAGNVSSPSATASATTLTGTDSAAFSVTNLTVTSGSAYEVESTGLDIGTALYVDRTYTAMDPIPSIAQGTVFIRTANDDKNLSPGSSSFLSFDVDTDVTVYVLHDDRVSRPTWLSTWVDTGSSLQSSDGNTTYSILEKSFTAGTVTLGSNSESSAIQSSMYVVAISVDSSSDADSQVVQQDIPLQQGWNLVSTRVIPSNTTMEALFTSVADNIELVKDEDGLIYSPTFGINDIGSWNPEESYMVYATAPVTLTIEGQPMQPESTSISLSSGWNMIAYIRSSTMAVEEALASLGSDLVLVKDQAGRVYSPEFGFNEIGSMEPGRGYKAYVSGDVTFTYPPDAAAKSGASLTSGSSIGLATSATLLVHAGRLDDGSTVSVWSGDMEVGAGTVRNGKAAVTIRGDDELTDEIVEGAKPGGLLTLQVQVDGAPASVEQRVVDVLTAEPVTSDLRYREDAAWLTRIEEIPQDILLEQNYPNPFNPVTLIRYSLSNAGAVSLEVYDGLGRLVDKLVDERQHAGSYEVAFDATGHSSGVYYYRLTAGDVVRVRQMILLK